MSFIGRSEEIALLRQRDWRNRGLLTAIYGRRRVGKTSLIEEAFKDDVLWKFEGVEGAKSALQIDYFLEQLSMYAQQDGSEHLSAKNWKECFQLLNAAIAKFTEQSSDRKLVVFLDEFQWLCSMRSSLVSEFKFFWDNYYQKHANTMFVICGSISSFIVKKVIQSQALYGRIDLEINLQPLTAAETRDFFSASRPDDELLQTQMILGGIPQYLQQLNPKWTLIQNLNEQAFRSNGYFFQEYERLFISHFSKNQLFKLILIRLAQGSCSGKDIAKAINRDVGGTLTQLLEELVLAGFVDRYYPVGKGTNSRLLRYRLNDEYLHFYFSQIKPNAPKILSGAVNYAYLSNQRSFQQWLGYAFERYCLKNAHQIADILRFSGVSYQFGSWFQRADADSGSQVDLVFARADKMLSVCEIKFVQKPQIKKWQEEMAAKVESLQKAFPGHGAESVLILGQGGRSEAAENAFDHVIYHQALV